MAMNWERIQTEWTQFRGRAKQRWGKLALDDLESCAGQREVLAGRLSEAYALSKQDAERQISEWQRSLDAAAATRESVATERSGAIVPTR
jgi:uncharacterized protein YjbJ (UPF0337 family)